MKHLAMLLSSACLLIVPSLPASASGGDVAAIDNWQCLVWLLTDPDSHAATCGGPFTVNNGTAPLVKGGSDDCDYQISEADLPSLDFLDRIYVAQSVQDCCIYAGSIVETFGLTFGQEILVAAEPCYNPD